jgi:Protein of unknown function (DUF2948)
MLHLTAFDGDDLVLLSAQLQDAVVTYGDMRFLKRSRQFVFLANRFAWDKMPENIRRRSGVKINGVMKVRRLGPAHLAATTVLSMLSLSFVGSGKEDDPSGVLTLTFAGGHAVALDVECLDVQLDDLGPTWSALGQPDHEA